MFKTKIKVPSTKFTDLFALAARVFKVRPFRTILTILGIGVSFATIFFLLSLGYGLQNILLSQISSSQALLGIDVTTTNAQAIPLDQKAITSIQAIDGVNKVYPSINSPGQIESGQTVTDATVESGGDDLLSQLQTTITSGKMPQAGTEQVLLSDSLVSLIFPANSNPLGQQVNVTAYAPTYDSNGVETDQTIALPNAYTVVGVVKESDNTVVVPFNDVQNLGLPYGAVKVVVKTDASLEPVRTKITAMGFDTSVLADTVDQANQVFRIFQFILALFGAAALVVAIIGMVNTMTISLLERVHEIGIMKIFGITTGDIKKLFYLESTLVGFLGGLSGLTMGYLLSVLFNLVVAFLARSLGGNPVDLFFYPTWFIVSILVFSSAVGFLIGISPAKTASRLDPLKALNYK